MKFREESALVSVGIDVKPPIGWTRLKCWTEFFSPHLYDSADVDHGAALVALDHAG